LWHQKYHTRLSYVTGAHYDTAYIAVYSKDRPKPYFTSYPHQSLWIHLKDFKQKGALLIWNVDDGPKQAFMDIKDIYPYYQNVKALKLYYFHPTTSAKVSLIPVIVGFIPPQKP